MSDNVTAQLENLLEHAKDAFQDTEEYKKYSEALKAYQQMVLDGLIKPRGNRLIEIEERGRMVVLFNTLEPATK